MTIDERHDTIDELVRALYGVAGPKRDDAVRDSRSAGLARLRGSRLAPSRSRRRLGRMIPALAVCGAILVAIALAPDHDGSRVSRIPALTADADAAEALAWAGAIVSGQDGATGDGDVWHTVRVTRTNGVDTRISEEWVDVRDRQRLGIGVRYFNDDHPTESVQNISIVSQGKTTTRLRSYSRRPGDASWDVTPTDLAVDVTGDGATFMPEPFGGPSHRIISSRINGVQTPVRDPEPPKGSYLPFRISATVDRDEATRRWIAAVSGTASPAEVERATGLFLRTTRGFFAMPGMDANPRARQATTVRQLLHLLTNAPVTPEATSLLYDRFGRFDQLRRLSDIDVDGRPALRIQFETGDISGLPDERMDPGMGDYMVKHAETVLVIDRATGRPVRTERLDGSAFTEFRPLERVKGLGLDPVVCRGGAFAVPCELLRFEGQLARKADVRARSERSRSIGESLVRSRFQFDVPVDEDGLPVGDVDTPIGYIDNDWGTPVPVLPLQPLPKDALG